MMMPQIKILFEDNHVIVAVKPAGVLAQEGELDLPDMLTLLKAYLKEKYQKPGNVFLGLVHRLDLNVGGVMVFAKTSKAASRLAEAVREHEFTKEYLAVVHGHFESTFGEFTDYLAKDEEAKKAVSATETTGKLAKLQYEVLEQKTVDGQALAFVKVTLLSGRFHQIRFQFAHRDHPLYGDVKYGSPIRKSDEVGLFAYRLSFEHPTKDETLSFTEIPSDGVFAQFDRTRFQ